jgi:hypothetical protein
VPLQNLDLFEKSISWITIGFARTAPNNVQDNIIAVLAKTRDLGQAETGHIQQGFTPIEPPRFTHKNRTGPAATLLIFRCYARIL